MTCRILIGDVMAMLATLPDESVHCCVTSPPYWGLRDYGVEGQIGLEPTLGEHLSVMVAVFEEVKRVLRKDGTCWVNCGDCYATSPNGRSAADTKSVGNDDRTFRDKPFSTVGPINRGKRLESGAGNRWSGGSAPAGGYLKPKDLCMIPNRLAIALQEAGWWVRSEIVWHKPNPMPESIKDRPGSSHEKVWLLTKSKRYWYDAEVVKTQATYPDGPNAPDKIKSPHGQGYTRSARKRGQTPQHAKYDSGNQTLDDYPRGQRNLRNVWTVPTKPFAAAHFATFPPALIEPCILAGCPIGGTVLDPFGGSGTVGLVCELNGRDSILIELNPDYAAMADSRIRLAHGDVTGDRIDHKPGMPLFDSIPSKEAAE